MRPSRKTAFILALVLVLPVIAGCNHNPVSAVTQKPSTTSPHIGPEAFLELHGLKVKESPSVFPVKVPENWEVPLGSYPVGIYWGLANEFSRDAGLDLTLLKGKTVEVRRFSLADGLPGEGIQSRYKYPSNVVLLVQDEKVAGSWLTFNVLSIGPSVKKRSLEQITGLSFEEWVEREKYFSVPGENADLAALGPTGVLDAFFEAINRGDKTRANACLSPRALLNTLTMNLKSDCLYNPDFGHNNSLVENILKAKPVSYMLIGKERPVKELKEIGERKEITVGVVLDIQWRDQAFNSPAGRQERFALLKKYPNGWKLSGLGTGP